MPRPIEFVGRGPGGLCGPAQRRHRIPTLLRFHPGQQGIEQTRIGECPLLADLAVLQFHHVLGDRDRAGPGGSGNRRKPGMAQRPDLRPQRQPALIQMGRVEGQVRRWRVSAITAKRMTTAWDSLVRNLSRNQTGSYMAGKGPKAGTSR